MSALWGVALVSSLLLAGIPAAAQQATQDDARHARRLGILLGSDAPMKIRSDELEARSERAGERVVFRHHVEVVQEDLHLNCDRLEAVYVDGDRGGPASIVATGNVHIRQAETEVNCTRMVFDRVAGEAECTADPGWAVLRRGEDVVEGKRIEFDLRDGIVRVRGGARVRMVPVREDAEGGAALPPVAESGK